MSQTPPRIRRGLLVALALTAVVLLVARLRTPAGGRDALIPAIGGDTWPPVPVKNAGSV